MPGIEITVWRHNSGTYRFRRPASGKIGQVRAEKSALALDHVTLRAGRFAKKERFASRCISCERHACACALQSSKVRDEDLRIAGVRNRNEGIAVFGTPVLRMERMAASESWRACGRVAISGARSPPLPSRP